MYESMMYGYVMYRVTVSKLCSTEIINLYGKNGRINERSL